MTPMIGRPKGDSDAHVKMRAAALTMKWLIWCLPLLLWGCSDDAPRVLGSVERDRLTLTAPVGGLIESVDVIEGQAVQAGQVLVRLDAVTARARVVQRQAELAQAKARLDELKSGARKEALARAKAALAGTNASLKEAQQSFERIQQLFTTKVVTRATFDDARASLDSATAKQAEAQQMLYELENGTRTEQLAQASAAVMAATAGVEIEQKMLAELTLIAAQDAVVDTLPWHQGDRVAAGTQLVGLLATDKPYVRVYLPATWLDHVHPGSKVSLYVDGREPDVDGRERAIEGEIRHIRSQPAFTPFYALNERDRARLMYLTDVIISSEGQDLPTGMIVEVELP